MNKTATTTNAAGAMQPATVYILFHETNTGGGDESDGYVEAVYATREAAETARMAQLRKLIADGRTTWTDPDKPEERPDTDWTDELVVLEEPVIGSEPVTGNLLLATVQQARESARVAELDLRLALNACEGRGAAYMVLYRIAEVATTQHQHLDQLAGLLEYERPPDAVTEAVQDALSIASNMRDGTRSTEINWALLTLKLRAAKEALK